MKKNVKTIIDRAKGIINTKGLAVMVWDSGFELQKTGLVLGVSKGGILKVANSRGSAAKWELDLNQALCFGFSNTIGGANLLEIIIR